MKRKLIILGALVWGAVFFTACEPEKSFDSALLIGKWERNSPFATEEKSGNEYYRYDANNKGATWDSSEGVEESEADTFSWTLEKDMLKQLHDMAEGESKIPKNYTVTVLNASTLTYKDGLGKLSTFKKSK